MREHFVEELLKASGGKIIGRMRLQKTVYLLDAKGANSESYFIYHHYGPYSEDLAKEVEMATSLSDKVIEEEKLTSQAGYRFSTFRLKYSEFASDRVGDLSSSLAGELLGKLERYPSVILEVASTIHWLVEKEEHQDWRSELVVRKGSKATEENLFKAQELLGSLGLSVN